MSSTYTDTVVNNLSKLPETVRWQNNVTRLNQTNMNTIGSAINVFTQTFRDLGIGVTNGFNNVDLNIKNLNDWKEGQLTSGDLHDYIQFRDTYQEGLEDLATIYTNTGINYGNSNVFKIESQNSKLQLKGTSVDIFGPTTFNNGTIFNGQTSFKNGILVNKISTYNSNVTIDSPLSINSTLDVSGKTTLDDVVATSLEFGVLIDKDDNTLESFDELQTKINPYEAPYDIDNREQYEESVEIPAVKFVQSALDAYEDYILEQVPSGGGSITVDQDFNPTSENAQSGKAVNQSIYSIIDADIKTVSGKVVAIKDVSPIQHDVKVKASVTGEEMLTKTVEVTKPMQKVLLDTPATSVRVVVEGDTNCVGGLVPMVDGDDLTASEVREQVVLWPPWSYDEASGGYDLEYTISGKTLSWSGIKYYTVDINQSEAVSGTIELSTTGQKITGFCQVYALDEDNPYYNYREPDNLNMTVEVYESTHPVETGIKVYGKNLFDAQAAVTNTYQEVYKPSYDAENDVIYTDFKNGSLYLNGYSNKAMVYPAGTYTITVVPVSETVSMVIYAYPEGTNTNALGSIIVDKKTAPYSETKTFNEPFWIAVGGYNGGGTYGKFYYKLQIEQGTGTEYERYKEPEIYIIDAKNGSSLPSCYPSMTFIPDNENINLSVEYNCYTNETGAAVANALMNNVGEETSEGGEIFNTYEDNSANNLIKNKALTKSSHAEGNGTIAGVKVFNILNYRQYSSVFIMALDSIENLSIGDVVSIKFNANYDLVAPIFIIGPTDDADLNLADNEIAIEAEIVPESGYEDKGILWVSTKPDIGTTPWGDSQHAEGRDSYAVGTQSHTEGYANISAGRYAHTEGTMNIAGYSAHAEGRHNQALGRHSHAEGRKTISKTDESHSEGRYTVAKGGASHSEGLGVYSTTDFKDKDGDTQGKASNENYGAHGLASHTEGIGTYAKGDASHAEGIGREFQTQDNNSGDDGTPTNVGAIGKASHSEGYKTFAKGDYSHTEGKGTITSGEGNHAEGIYNDPEINVTTINDFNYGVAISNDAKLDNNVKTVIIEDNKIRYDLSIQPFEKQNNHTVQINKSSVLSGESNFYRLLPNTQYSLTLTLALASDIVENTKCILDIYRGNSLSYSPAMSKTQMKSAEFNVTRTPQVYNVNFTTPSSVENGYKLFFRIKSTSILDGSYFYLSSLKLDIPYLSSVGNGTSDSNRSNAFTVHQDGHAEVQKVGDTDNSVVTKKYTKDTYASKSHTHTSYATKEEVTNEINSKINIFDSDNMSIMSNEVKIYIGNKTPSAESFPLGSLWIKPI